jgi:hypothetical protein
MVMPEPHALAEHDLRRLLMLGLATWSARGESETEDEAGRVWVFSAEGGALLVEAAQGFAVEAARVGAAADLASAVAAVAGRLGSLQMRSGRTPDQPYRDGRNFDRGGRSGDDHPTPGGVKPNPNSHTAGGTAYVSAFCVRCGATDGVMSVNPFTGAFRCWACPLTAEAA